MGLAHMSWVVGSAEEKTRFFLAHCVSSESNPKVKVPGEP